MKKILLLLLCSLLSLCAFADEGMWLPSLIAPRIKDMRAKGFRLTADDIYSVNKASMKDAVVLFDGGCTGEIISAEGLMLTNHHCGYGAIQKHSTVEHDYLTDGFWARSREEELPNEKLYVLILVRMEEVTDRINRGETTAQIVAQAEKEGQGFKASVEQMYYGNQQFLFVYRQFNDVRLVGAPPSSIGKFGGDTDNWIWPRHTGDFSVFRIYADAKNQPADYAVGNVPYQPKRHFNISTKGVAEGDFTMIYGFPGNTQKYILSSAVDYLANRADPAKIRIRTERIQVLTAAQAADPAIRIFYAAHNASIANSWKKWQGEVLGLNRLGTIQKKQTYEKAFALWAQDKPAYRTVIDDLNAEYARIKEAYFTRELMNETFFAPEINQNTEKPDAAIYTKIAAIDSALYRVIFREYNDNCPAAYLSPYFVREVKRLGSVEALSDSLYRATHDRIALRTHEAPLKPLFEDLYLTRNRIDSLLGDCSRRNLNSAKLNELYAIYLRGLREWDHQRAFSPDANLTLRVAYGKVAGYEYADGDYHLPCTTLEGIIAKDNPAIYDYDIPEVLRNLYASKDYGRWGITVNGRKTIPVCFLATNHTTGGNSGSPVLNGKGELVGINFDRTWLSTSSDIEFDPEICRNIAVDIRYVLFVIDKIGKASYLMDEMTLKE
ncbi:MAG: S46 family peptidase [Alistipes sp.]